MQQEKLLNSINRALGNGTNPKAIGGFSQRWDISLKRVKVYFGGVVSYQTDTQRKRGKYLLVKQYNCSFRIEKHMKKCESFLAPIPLTAGIKINDFGTKRQ